MRKIIPITLLFESALLQVTAASAQTEFSQLFVKGYVSPGTGVYFDIAIAAPGRGNWWMIEPSTEYFYNYQDYYAFGIPYADRHPAYAQEEVLSGLFTSNPSPAICLAQRPSPGRMPRANRLPMPMAIPWTRKGRALWQVSGFARLSLSRTQRAL